MTIQQYEKAEYLMKQNEELKKMLQLLGNKNFNVYVIGSNFDLSSKIEVPDNMRIHMLIDCNNEIEKVEQEFQNL